MCKKFFLQDKAVQTAGLTIVSLTIIISAFSLFHPGLPSGHDIAAHTIRSRLFIDALQEGQFPVRWISWVKNGFDQPLFNFVQVGFYYLVALLYLFSFSITAAVKVAVLILWWLGGGLTFLYAKRFGVLPAAAAAVIFIFTPYIISDIFVRAAYPELGAISFNMGILWALDRLLIKGKKLYLLFLSLFSASATIFHLPTQVIFVPLFLGYTILLFITKEAKLKNLKLVLIGTSLGTGMVAFYLLPALIELPLVKSSLLTAGYYNFQAHFVYLEQLFSLFWGYGVSQAGLADGMSFQFGLIQWSIIGLSFLMLVFKRLKNYPVKSNHLIFWLLAVLYVLFFIHEISLSFWENFSALDYIQYPWRFIMIIALVSAVCGAILISFLKSWLQALTILTIIVTILIFNRIYLTPATFLPNNYFNIDSADYQQSQGVTAHTVFEEGYSPISAVQLPNDDLPKWSILTGKGRIQTQVLRNHLYSLQIQAATPLVLQINAPFFPGWKADLNNQQTDINYNNNFGYMQINIPAGSNQLLLQFTNTPIRFWANLITIISAILLLLLLVLLQKIRY